MACLAEMNLIGRKKNPWVTPMEALCPLAVEAMSNGLFSRDDLIGRKKNPWVTPMEALCPLAVEAMSNGLFSRDDLIGRKKNPWVTPMEALCLPETLRPLQQNYKQSNRLSTGPYSVGRTGKVLCPEFSQIQCSEIWPPSWPWRWSSLL
jgi:hypothetical protein